MRENGSTQAGQAAKNLIHVLDQSIAWFDQERSEAIDIMVKIAHSPPELAAETYDLEHAIEVMPKDAAVSRGGMANLIAAMRSIGDPQGESVTPSQFVMPGITVAGP